MCLAPSQFFSLNQIRKQASFEEEEKIKGNGKIPTVSLWNFLNPPRMGVWTPFCPNPSLLPTWRIRWRRRSLCSVPQKKMAAIVSSLSNLRTPKTPKLVWSVSSIGMYCWYPWEEFPFSHLLIRIQCTFKCTTAFFSVFFFLDFKWGCQKPDQWSIPLCEFHFSWYELAIIFCGVQIWFCIHIAIFIDWMSDWSASWYSHMYISVLYSSKRKRSWSYLWWCVESFYLCIVLLRHSIYFFLLYSGLLLLRFADWIFWELILIQFTLWFLLQVFSNSLNLTSNDNLRYPTDGRWVFYSLILLETFFSFSFLFWWYWISLCFFLWKIN